MAKDKIKDNKVNSQPGTPASTPTTKDNPSSLPNIDMSNLTPEQTTQLQLEQAIKESTDPSAKLRKLKSPLSFKGCLLQLLFLIVLSVTAFFVVIYFQVDRFELGTIVWDILKTFGVVGLVNTIINFFKKLFGG